MSLENAIGDYFSVMKPAIALLNVFVGIAAILLVVGLSAPFAPLDLQRQPVFSPLAAQVRSTAMWTGNLTDACRARGIALCPSDVSRRIEFSFSV